ncbi:DNA polymerase delta, subunit 4-domain-containing protein [Mycena amicta]|nr:DNA polymerase delta, subunit 4-domain-containing protein [Mycena amicta]
MPKATKSSSQPTLKQATLSFSASKRTASATNNKKAAPRAVPAKDVVDEIEISSGSESDFDDVEIIESDGSFTRIASTPTKKATSVRSLPKFEDILDIDEPLDISPTHKRWEKHAREVKAKRGDVKLIHAEAENVFHDILRVFDMSYEYGPCIGLTRLERWKRATALGLSPPIEVHDILLSNQGNEYAQSVLHGQV